ncbi:peptidylprolyl isomerase [bacterium]|nr:MAG: peptidylprolyl isomerase [bacterium]
MVALAILPALALVGQEPVVQPVPAAKPVVQALLTDAAPGAVAPKEGDEVAVLETSLGRIVLKFFPAKAPGHVKNFEDLAKKEFYDGTKFHRVIKGFMIQGGDPLTKDDSKASMWGTGDPGYKIDAEFNDTPHTRGVLSMARSQSPDSAGSQFFICHKDSKFLDNNYTVFGQVVDGMKTVDKIAETPTTDDRPNEPVVLKTVKIEKWPLK